MTEKVKINPEQLEEMITSSISCSLMDLNGIDDEVAAATDAVWSDTFGEENYNTLHKANSQFIDTVADIVRQLVSAHVSALTL